MYRHAVEGQLAVDLEQVGLGHPSTGVHQRVAELERKRKRTLNFIVAVASVLPLLCKPKLQEFPPGRTSSVGGPSPRAC